VGGVAVCFGVGEGVGKSLGVPSVRQFVFALVSVEVERCRWRKPLTALRPLDTNFRESTPVLVFLSLVCSLSFSCPFMTYSETSNIYFISSVDSKGRVFCPFSPYPPSFWIPRRGSSFFLVPPIFLTLFEDEL